MKYIEFQINDRLTIESPVDSEARAASQLLKQRYTRPFKRLLRWGVGIATKVQLGNLVGSLGAIALPHLAITAALLISLAALWFVLAHPGSEVLSPIVAGLAWGYSMAKHWLTLQSDLKIRQLLKLSAFRLGIESSRGILWLVRATVQGAPELAKEAVSLIELGSLLIVKVAPKIKARIGKLQDRIDLSFTRIDSVLKDLSKAIGAIPYGGHFIDDAEDSDTTVAAATIDQPITDIREATKGRHLIVLGDTGTGKTTTAQYVAVENSILGGVSVKVYDCEGMFKLLPGWTLIGAGEDFDAINTAMAEDLSALSEFFATGQVESKEPTHIHIGEEFPDIADQCDNASSWVDRHSRRGRKAGRFLILLSQYDQISAFGLEGKSSLLKNFRIIRLGEFALAHAKRLKNPALVKWLEASKSHCLINDSPLQLPAYEEMVRVVNQFSLGLASVPIQSLQLQTSVIQKPVQGFLYNRSEFHRGADSDTVATQQQYENTTDFVPETTHNQGLQPSETSFSETSGGGEIALLERILAAFQDGRSDDWVAKNVIMETQRIGYRKARDKAEAI
jgi:hypothetical protein